MNLLEIQTPHPHLNILTLSTIPPVIEAEAEASHKILNEKGVCHMCQTINEELSGPRQILQTDGFIAFSPWAPSYPYEFWISPKKHTTSFSKITQKEINDLSLILRASLGGLSKKLSKMLHIIWFSIFLLKRKILDKFIGILKFIRLQNLGLDWNVDMVYHLNDVSPEEAAEKLGAACRKELANLVGII